MREKLLALAFPGAAVGRQKAHESEGDAVRLENAVRGLRAVLLECGLDRTLPPEGPFAGLRPLHKTGEPRQPLNRDMGKFAKTVARGVEERAKDAWQRRFDEAILPNEDDDMSGRADFQSAVMSNGNPKA